MSRPSTEKIGIALAAALTPDLARADTVADFYRGKHINLVTSASPGGGYDLYGRALAKFIGRHIPGNPTVIPVNMPGAASMVLLFSATERAWTLFTRLAGAK